MTRASIVGGEARSDLWNQIKVDVTACPIKRVRVDDAAALGSAILASVGTQLYQSAAQGASEMVKFDRAYHPREKAVANSAILRRYEDVYSAIESSYYLDWTS